MATVACLRRTAGFARLLPAATPRRWAQVSAKVLAPAPELSTDVPSPSSIPGPGQKPLRGEPPSSLREMKLGFIGWGAMAQAVSLGIIRAGLTEASLVKVTDVVPEVTAAAQEHGLQVASSNAQLVKWADVVLVAVKPQVVDLVLQDIAPHWGARKMLISICAGVTIDSFVQGLGPKAKVVRVMPNTPCLVGEAATAYAGNALCADWELELAHQMFSSVGRSTHRVPESLLNAVTGLSGSGPAYVYMMIQAMADAGVHGGLPRTVALGLAAQTVAGAARMVQESGRHPAELQEAVTSPAGTTIAGVRSLEGAGFRSAVVEAVEAARVRSQELSQATNFV